MGTLNLKTESVLISRNCPEFAWFSVEKINAFLANNVYLFFAKMLKILPRVFGAFRFEKIRAEIFALLFFFVEFSPKYRQGAAFCKKLLAIFAFSVLGK